jgi:preprotein translocase subunit SecG
LGFLVGFLTLVYFATCVILIIIVLMQEPKGGGLSSAFGGAGLDTAFGASIGRKISSFTVYLAIFFVVLTIGLAILSKSSGAAAGSSIMDGMQSPAPAQPQEQEREKSGENEKTAPPSGDETAPDADTPKEPGSGQQEPAGRDNAAGNAQEETADEGSDTETPGTEEGQ